jgi:hypothetical protein
MEESRIDPNSLELAAFLGDVAIFKEATELTSSSIEGTLSLEQKETLLTILEINDKLLELSAKSVGESAD